MSGLKIEDVKSFFVYEVWLICAFPECEERIRRHANSIHIDYGQRDMPGLENMVLEKANKDGWQLFTYPDFNGPTTVLLCPKHAKETAEAEQAASGREGK